VEHLPRWIGKFIPSVKYVHDNEPSINAFHQRPFDAVMRSFVSLLDKPSARLYLIWLQKAQTLKPSFIGSLIEARESRGSDDEESYKTFTDAELKGTGGSLYSAGQDTTFSSISIFALAMVLTPEVQTKAHKEIDAVTGGKRLPVFDDWKALPIVERIVYETLRLVNVL